MKILEVITAFFEIAGVILAPVILMILIRWLLVNIRRAHNQNDMYHKSLK